MRPLSGTIFALALARCRFRLLLVALIPIGRGAFLNMFGSARAFMERCGSTSSSPRGQEIFSA